MTVDVLQKLALATPTPTSSQAPQFYTPSKRVTRSWPDPNSRGLQLGFPRNQLTRTAWA